MNLADLLSEFEFHCEARELSSKPVKGYQLQCGYLLNYLKETHSITTLEAVKPVYIKQFLVYMQKKNRKPSYINDLLKAFKCMFKYAFEEGYTSTLLTERVQNVKEPKVLIRSFSNKEVKGIPLKRKPATRKRA